MEYVAIGILFLLVLAGGITMFVMVNTKRSHPAVADDERDTAAAPLSGPDSTPMGDTAQHAGQQDTEGQTVSGGDASGHGGTGAKTSGEGAQGRTPGRVADEPEGGRFKRDPVGGEAEAEPAIEAEPHRPAGS